MPHIPVLLHEIIKILDLKNGDAVIDGTAGAGGHAREILKHINPNGKLLLVDWDAEAIKDLKIEMKNFKNVTCIAGNYAELPNLMKKNNFPKADKLLLDLGFSSEQLEKRGRGFSFVRNEPLIMTYSDKMEPLDKFLKHTDVDELTKIIRDFGEERYAKQIAKAIISARDKIFTSKMLGEIIKEAVPKSYEKGRIHPATRTFQALRIFLNKELDNLKKFLDSLDEILNNGGRVVIISFHSLEDRIVKRYFAESAKKGRLKILTKKPIIASPEEVAVNPRSRSAKLRAAAII
jgi:16S rRNA (cytosine1402-N4)-methyltransferase